MDSTILIAAPAAGYIAKVLVDVFRLRSATINGWWPPALALLFGILAALLLRIAATGAATWQTAAQDVLAGILAGAGAIGATTLQSKVAEDRYGAMNAMLLDGQALRRQHRDHVARIEARIKAGEDGKP